MSTRPEQASCLEVFLFVLVLLLVCGPIDYWRAKQKSDAYFRVTGRYISPWDCMFLDPQVRDNGK